ncbi:rod shape-determining protein MreD [Tolumonas lignilytica]|uniref:rod shape-determining protein MreD n=1 Tax=Tolumonas lignilytica TaxID=1283284 RepID=UPI000466AB55|nr:rod shape-determining protein MreD [Tolumonas lignilytica]
MSGSLTGHGKGSIYLTLIVAIILTMVPLPAVIDMFRPDWVALVVLYWVIALPHQLSVVSAWVVGLLMDILLGSTLGVHALGMAVISCVAGTQYQQLRNFSVWQQALVMGALIFVDQLLVFWVEHLFSSPRMNPRFAWAALSSTLIWPSIYLFLRYIRRRFNIR